MIKMVALLKRRAGMSFTDFQNYYESQHSRIGEVCFPGRAIRYMRRYLRPMQHPILGFPDDEPEFDVVTEAWFEDDASLQAAMELFIDSPLGELVKSDEAKLFDRSRIRMWLLMSGRQI